MPCGDAGASRSALSTGSRVFCLMLLLFVVFVCFLVVRGRGGGCWWGTFQLSASLKGSEWVDLRLHSHLGHIPNEMDSLSRAAPAD